MITLAQMTRELTAIVGSQLKLEFKEDSWFSGLANQTHVDFIIENPKIELEQSLDDLAEKILTPIANLLVNKLKLGKAKYCYKLPVCKNYPSSVEWYNQCSIRGIVNPKHIIIDDDGNTKIVSMYRFDIGWSQ